MGVFLSEDKVNKIVELRSRGYSLSEIKKQVGISNGTAWNYIQGVKIKSRYLRKWESKKKSSVARKIKALREAEKKAKKAYVSISDREKELIFASLYWAEGNKLDFCLTNSDPEIIGVFVKVLKEKFLIPDSQLRLNIRIYEDMDKKECVDYWLKVTNLNKSNISSLNILKGKKIGKLKYGMCRVRVKKGGNMLKYVHALKTRVSKLILSP